MSLSPAGDGSSFRTRFYAVHGKRSRFENNFRALLQQKQNSSSPAPCCPEVGFGEVWCLSKARRVISARPVSGQVPDSHALLAERIESLVSQENAKWASVQQQEPSKVKPS